MPRPETTNASRLVVPDYTSFCFVLIDAQALYNRALKVRSAVPHPKIMGIIRECGGKMHMSEGKVGLSMGILLQLIPYQKTGQMLRSISTNHFAIMMKPALFNEYRF